mgnify:CR=1 FL=1
MLFVILFLLQLKHWYIDFVNQTPEEVKSKGVYGKPIGVWHSLKHAIATGIIFTFVDYTIAIVVFCFDLILHYHIDYAKMNFGCQDINNPKFWNHLGLDQLLHQLCYILYVYLIIYT